MGLRSHGLRIGLLLLLAAAVQAWMLGRNPLPAQDGVRFVRIAGQFAHQPFAATIQGNVQHPLYPLLVSWYQRAFVGLAAPAEAWLISAQRTAALAAVLLVVPMYLAGLRLNTHAWVAAGATALFTLLPVTARLGADALSESTYLLFFLAGLWAALEYVERRQAWWLLVAGMGSGLAYLARPEGLMLPVAIGVTLLVLQIPARSRWPWKSLAWAVAGLTAGVLLFVAPYVYTTGKLTAKNSLAMILRRAARLPSRIEEALYRPDPPLLHDGRLLSPSAAPVVLPPPPGGRLDFTHKHGSPVARYQGYVPAIQEFAHELIEGLHYVFALVVLAGFRRTRLRVTNVLAIVLVSLFSLAVVQFASRSGYIASRHLLTLICLATYTAAEGGWRLAELLPPWLGRLVGGTADAQPRAAGLPSPLRWLAELTQPRLAGAMLLGATLFCLAKDFEPLHSSRIGHLRAGRWLAQHAAPTALVLDTRGWAALYSGLSAYSYVSARTAFEDARLSYVVVEREELQAPTARGATLRHLLGAAGRKLIEFAPPSRPDDAVVVYGWYADRLAFAESDQRRR